LNANQQTHLSINPFCALEDLEIEPPDNDIATMDKNNKEQEGRDKVLHATPKQENVQSSHHVKSKKRGSSSGKKARS